MTPKIHVIFTKSDNKIKIDQKNKKLTIISVDFPTGIWSGIISGLQKIAVHHESICGQLENLRSLLETKSGSTLVSSEGNISNKKKHFSTIFNHFFNKIYLLKQFFQQQLYLKQVPFLTIHRYW